MPHTIQPQSLARRRIRQAMIIPVALVLLAALLAGCAGPPLGSYHCTAPQHPVGCATVITFSHAHINPDSKPDIANNPRGLFSDMFIVPLTCNPACQASSGNGNPPGFISNYLELIQQNGGWYLRMGYTTTPTGLQYFVQFQMQGINSGQFTYMNLGAAVTGAGPNTDTPYRFAHVIVGVFGVDSIYGHAGDWFALFEPSYGPQFLYGVNLGPSIFNPTHAAFGQFIYGTSGATGLLAFFANNNIFATPFSAFHLQEIFTEDGSPPGVIQTVDHPSDARWFFPATKSSSGGMFYVSCC